MFAHFDSTPSAIAFLPRRREGVTPIPAGIVVGTSNGSLSALEIGTKSALTTGHGQRFAEISRAEQESAKIDSIAFMAAGDGFATGSEDGTVRIYRYPELSLEFELSAGHSVNSVSFSGDSRKVVAGLSNGKLLVWKHNGSSFELHRSASPFSAPISSVAFCRDDKIVTVAKSGVVEVLLESKGFARGVELPVSPSRYPAASVSADGNYIAMSWGDDVKCFKTVDILS
jgi:WD40 repeat protein